MVAMLVFATSFIESFLGPVSPLPMSFKTSGVSSPEVCPMVVFLGAPTPLEDKKKKIT